MNHSISSQPDSAATDPFFILRDSRALFQHRLTEVAHLAGITSPPVIEAFTEALGEAYDELATSNQRDGFEQTHGLTSSRITLMGDDDLELEIRIGDSARRFIDIGGNALWKAHLRYMTLLRRPAMAPEDNPVGPESICQGLWAICRTSGAGLEGNLKLLERIEEQLTQHLPELYNALNELLASRNVEPAQSKTVSIGGTGSTGIFQPSSGADGRPDFLSALQSKLYQQHGGTENGAISFTPGQGNTASGNFALSTATLVMLQQLTARLDQLELSGPAHLEGVPGAAENTLPQTVRAKDLDLPLGRPEAIALDTLALIFEAIFDTWELPDTVKTAIGRLQIPLLKLAIFDPSLFTNTEHPARRLINGMARAAIGVPRNVSRAHPVSSHLWQLSSTVSETLQGNAAVLTAPLADLDALIAQRDREILSAAQPYIALLRTNEMHEEAAQAAKNWLSSIEAQSIPEEILDFLHQYWVRVMGTARIGEEDDTSTIWQENETVITDLLWSVQPKQSADERKRLVDLVPNLLKRISTGLDRIGIPAEERTAFLDTCFKLQTAALRGNPPPAVRPPAQSPTQSPTNTQPPTGVIIKTLEAHGKQLKILAHSGQSASTYRHPKTSAKTGHWLQFEISDKEPLRGLVCWQSPTSGSTLLFNQDWGYAVAIVPDILEQQLRDARATVVSSLAIFDQAAERALSQLTET